MVRQKSGSRLHTNRVLFATNVPEGISSMQPKAAALRDPISSVFFILPARHALPLSVRLMIIYLRRDGIILLAVA